MTRGGGACGSRRASNSAIRRRVSLGEGCGVERHPGVLSMTLGVYTALGVTIAEEAPAETSSLPANGDILSRRTRERVQPVSSSASPHRPPRASSGRVEPREAGLSRAALAPRPRATVSVRVGIGRADRGVLRRGRDLRGHSAECG